MCFHSAHADATIHECGLQGEGDTGFTFAPIICQRAWWPVVSRINTFSASSIWRTSLNVPRKWTTSSSLPVKYEHSVKRWRVPVKCEHTQSEGGGVTSQSRPKSGLRHWSNAKEAKVTAVDLWMKSSINTIAISDGHWRSHQQKVKEQKIISLDPNSCLFCNQHQLHRWNQSSFLVGLAPALSPTLQQEHLISQKAVWDWERLFVNPSHFFFLIPQSSPFPTNGLEIAHKYHNELS